MTEPTSNRCMHICCVTGTRADYGIYRPLLQELQQARNVRLSLAVTGMHLYKEYGQTVKEIYRDGFGILSESATLTRGDTTHAMVQAAGLGLLHFADLFSFHRPDQLLVLGDRGEMLAAAWAGHYLNIPVNHLHGGETSGSADDSIRHAISHLASRHFTACKQATEKLLSFGFAEDSIYTVGSLRKSDMTQIKQWPVEKKELLRKKYGIRPNEKKLLFLMHPDTKETLSGEEQLKQTFAGMESFRGYRWLMIGANSDAGGELVNSMLKDWLARSAQSTFYPSVPADEYLFLLSEVDVLVGNSSSGIIEAPFFQLPVVTIGNRQQNRARGNNVYEAGYDHREIERAIRTQLERPRYELADNPYDLLASPEQAITHVLMNDWNGHE